MRSLYEILNVSEKSSEGTAVESPAERSEFPEGDASKWTAEQFCQAIINTKEFRKYLVDGIVMADLPPTVVGRILDHGWGRPVERIERTDKTDLEDITLEAIEKRLENTQRLLQLLRAAKEDSPETTIHDQITTRSVH